MHTHCMQKWGIFVAMAFVLASCGEADTLQYSGGAGLLGEPTGLCETFVEETLPLGVPRDTTSYQKVLRDAIRPVVDYAVDHELVSTENPDLVGALERLYAGDAGADDLWAVDTLGLMLTEYGVPGCERIWDSLGPMAPRPTQAWDTPPVVEITSDYAAGTADHACDVFIKTINVWEVDASRGAEYGPSMAEAVDALIHELEAFDIHAATPKLEAVASLWRSKPWVQANEEGGMPLSEAGAALVGVGSGRCADLFDAVLQPSHESETPVEVLVTPIIEVEALPTFDPVRACGYAVLPSMSSVLSTQPLDADALQAMDAFRGAEEVGSWFTNTFQYEIFSRTDDRLVLFGTAANGSHSDAAFDRVDGAWKISGWGSCEWQPADYRQVTWQLHPDFLFDPEARVVDLLAVDECGSVAEEGNEVVVVADYAGDTVAFEVWQSLYPPPSSDGVQEDTTKSCLVGARLHLHVLLPDPIGDRSVEGGFPGLDNFAG